MTRNAGSIVLRGAPRVVPATLRRADWRFLLPAPPSGRFERLVLLGGPPGLAERLREAGMARDISGEVGGERSADALAILADARIPVKEALRCLAPGGVLYYEVDRSASGSFTTTPGSVQRELKEAGFVVTGAYWARPNFSRCAMYIPLDLPAALKWYCSTLLLAGSRRRQLLAPALRVLASLKSKQLAALVPCYAVTATTAGDSERSPLINGSVLAAGVREADLRSLVIMNGDDEHTRVIGFPFTPSSTRPIAVVKAPRWGAYSGYTSREQATLKEIRALVDADLQRTLPMPLGQLQAGELTLGSESYLAGRRLVVSTSQAGASLDAKIEDLRLAAAWLTRFHRQARLHEEMWGWQGIARWIETPIVHYTGRFGTTPAEERLFGMVRKHASTLSGLRLPIVWQHHDFNELNVMRAGKEISVIDWERARPGPPVCDLLYFELRWSFLARQLRGAPQQARGFRELFVDPVSGDACVQAARRATHRYLAQVGIDRRFFPLLLVVTWLEHALDYFDRLRALAQAPADPRSQNHYIGYINSLAEGVDVLFSTANEEWRCAS